VTFKTARFVAFGLVFGALGAAASLHPSEASAAQCGKASWYKMGSRTASGEPMNANALAAAHRTLPFGTQVRVENLNNHRTVVVRINDRGPFVGGRVIDVTRGAAVQLGMISTGTARVKVSVIDGNGDGLPVLNGCSS
jgi:rare lipoprotein A